MKTRITEHHKPFALMNLRHLIRCCFDYWSSIHLPRIDVIVHDCKKHNRSSNEAAVVHLRSIGVGGRWKKAEDNDYDTVTDPVGVE